MVQIWKPCLLPRGGSSSLARLSEKQCQKFRRGTMGRGVENWRLNKSIESQLVTPACFQGALSTTILLCYGYPASVCRALVQRREPQSLMKRKVIPCTISILDDLSKVKDNWMSTDRFSLPRSLVSPGAFSLFRPSALSLTEFACLLIRWRFLLTVVMHILIIDGKMSQPRAYPPGTIVKRFLFSDNKSECNTHANNIS